MAIPLPLEWKVNEMGMCIYLLNRTLMQFNFLLETSYANLHLP